MFTPSRILFSSLIAGDKVPNELHKSRSGCNNIVTDGSVLPPAVCKSKSDAKIGYSSTAVLGVNEIHQASSALLSDKCDIAEQDDSNEFITVKNTFYSNDIEHIQQEQDLNEHFLQHSDVKKIEGQSSEDAAAIPRTLKSPIREEVFDQPWTEVGGDSPKQVGMIALKQMTNAIIGTRN